MKFLSSLFHKRESVLPYTGMTDELKDLVGKNDQSVEKGKRLVKSLQSTTDAVEQVAQHLLSSVGGRNAKA